MLVLTRKIGQSIIISDNIVVKVLGKPINGVVRLGIDAPKDMLILEEDAILDKDKEKDNEAS